MAHLKRMSIKGQSSPETDVSSGVAHPHTTSSQRVVQRTSALPSALLRPDDIRAFQHTLGNRATRALVAPKPVSRTVLQRAYDGQIIDYNAIDLEKTQGEIHTGAKLLGTSLTKRVQKFHDAVKSGKPAKILTTLQKILKRLNEDSKKNLKKPKIIDLVVQEEARVAFFEKWKRITNEHIDHLSQDGEKAVVDFQETYGYKVSVKEEKKEKRNSSSEEDIKIIEKGESSKGNFDFNNIPWDDAKSAEVKDSGMGGAVILTFGSGHKVAVKGGGGIINNEVLGSRMAREVGLEAPETRLANSEENSSIPNLFKSLGATVKWGGPYLIVDFVPGIPITAVGDEKKPSKERIYALGYQMGRWYAFAVLNNDIDNFGDLTGGNVGVNTGNFFATKSNQVVGIDQHTVGGDLKKKAFTDIKEGSMSFAFTLGNGILKALGNPKGVDSEELGDIVMKGAQEQMKHMAEKLDSNKIKELCQGIEVNKLDEIMDRVETIADSYK